jgi:radical SAM enzyme (rSAM/lipoprotein system)
MIRKKYKRIPSLIESWKWEQAKKIMAKVHDLSYFFWEATLNCNLNCRHCGSDCSKSEKASELSAEKVLEVFSNIAQNYDPKKIMVAVTGGEPLVRKDLFDILAKISSYGFSWGMVTNGMLVDRTTVENCINAGMKTVSVSLDGSEPSHNWLRNNENSYERSINALKMFVDSGKIGVVEAITCVHERNIGELEDVYDTLKNIGINKWRLLTVFSKGRAEQNNELIVTGPLLTRLFEFIKSKREDGSLKVSYSEEGYLGCNWEREVRDNLFYCGAGINVASLLSDGSFSACPSLSREWIQGHMDEIDFSRAWETRYRNMRNREWMRNTECRGCKEWRKCSGSSLHLWDWQNNAPKVCHYRMLGDHASYEKSNISLRDS